MTMRISLPQARYGGDGQRAQFLDRFFQQVDALPGVEASGAISFLPLTGLGAATSMQIVGQPVPPQARSPSPTSASSRTSISRRWACRS